MDTPCRYSPLEISEYFIPTLERCEVRHIAGMPASHAVAVWNLYWLSHPGLDALPMLGSQWWKTYGPGFGKRDGQPVSLLRTVVEDVYGSARLRERLGAPPAEFADWWTRQRRAAAHTAAVAGADWRAQVLQRARWSHALGLIELPALVRGRLLHSGSGALAQPVQAHTATTHPRGEMPHEPATHLARGARPSRPRRRP